jgi:hypothetical protein
MASASPEASFGYPYSPASGKIGKQFEEQSSPSDE